MKDWIESLPVHDNLLLAFGGVFVALVVASVAVWALRRARPQSAEKEDSVRELADRIKSWWVMASVFLVAMILDRKISLAFFCFLSFLAFKEYLSMIPTRRADRRVLFWAYVALPIQYLWIGIHWYPMFLIWIPVYALLMLPLRMVLIGETKGFLRAVGTIHWGLMITVFAISHLAYLLVLPEDGNPNGGGPALVLYVVVLTQFNDVAQFLWGKALGRRPVVPTVSPNKTQEGLLGGLLTTVTLAWLLAPWLTPFDTVQSLAAGTIIGLGGFIGDVVISSLKRDLGIKDSGALIPGHGGILDRLDSLTYAAPLFFHYVKYLHF